MSDTRRPKRPAAPQVAFIDSIEEGVARLVQKNQKGEFISQSFPAALLPEGAREGSWIEVQVRVVPPPPGEDPAEVRKRLGSKDDGGDFSL